MPLFGPVLRGINRTMPVAAKAAKVFRPFEGIRVAVNTPTLFDEVTDRLRALMGKASVEEIIALAREPIGEAQFVQVVTSRFVGESGFTLFAEIDHGAWIQKFGIRRRSVRWILGNPVIAITMIRHDIIAGLFAPIELLITEHEDGKGTNITYLRPSSLMTIDDNVPLREAAEVLDMKAELLVMKATAQ